MHPALKIAATVLGAAAKPLRARLRRAAMTRTNDLMLAALLHPTTVGRAVLIASAEKPTELMARQPAVQIEALVADQQRRLDQQQPGRSP